MTEDSPTTALKLAELKASLDLGLERVQGSLNLLLQRQEQSDEKHKDFEKRLETVEGRKYVSPAVVWSSIAIAVAALGVLAAFLSVRS